MAGLWLTLALLSLAAPPNTGSLPADRNDQIRAAIKKEIEIYNKEQGRVFALCYITNGGAKSDPGVVHFFIKEGDCLKSKKKKKNMKCAFKDKGEVRSCSMAVPQMQDINANQNVEIHREGRNDPPKGPQRVLSGSLSGLSRKRRNAKSRKKNKNKGKKPIKRSAVECSS
ncbi:hypothetical protein XENTR_v10015792 [Xenopus tropicalis]|nr:hypothetical protein XENTR_v10015792 [Xenopus tropicalis]